MLLLLKLLQQLVKTLNSDGTPGQIAAGMALGAVLGLTPLINLHNLAILGAIMVLNVSFPGAMLGWALAVPVGFVLDPVFDVIGRRLLLETPALTPLWTVMGDYGDDVRIAAGDIDGDEIAEIALSTEQEDGAAEEKKKETGVVRLFKGTGEDYGMTFEPYGDLEYEKPATVAMGDIDGDGRQEYIVGAGAGWVTSRRCSCAA